MKLIDFTQPGGFPLTQDQLGYLQTAWSECLGALGSVGGNPVLLSGMNETNPGFGLPTTVHDGWLWFNNEVIRFIASSYGAIGVTQALYVVISRTATPVTYNDGISRSVIIENTATVVMLPNTTPVDATHFLYSSLLSFGKAIGINYREQSWLHIAVSTLSGSGTITGDVYYKKDITANTLQMRGVLTSATPTDFIHLPGLSHQLCGAVQPGYKPVTADAYFTAHIAEGDGYYLDSIGTYHSRFTGAVDTDGKLYFDIPKADATLSPSVTWRFNCIIPLD